MHRYADKVVLVTGAAGGLGKAITLRLASEGALVVATDLDSERLAAAFPATADSILKIHCIPLDVTNHLAFAQLVAEVAEQFGRLDVAVNNAGMGGEMTPLATYSLQSWEQVQRLNVDSVFYGMQAQITQMLRQGGGSIINIASIMGAVAMPGIAPYVASKHAVVGLTKGAALDYGSQGIRVNAIGPSFVRTGFTAAAIPDDDSWNHLASRHALAGTATPEDIAASVAFLGSDDARFITGSLHLVDGGYTTA
ncbi:SDR family oxidoreductase [Pseudomonas sp. PS1(2021)]|uniref:SDR family NAD(P)-dependent oxidoreductase n=1 Tax=Pseudomonas sp. PS1(2021) TaxID=2866282 RepID=UPI001CF0D175|nr:SDR family oxidoreductase [Pseudomonas sp. PS1(2021)]UCM29503.1 SDR family oxidoreductase [Pseudomonas sp. PS1(2021)]